MSTKQYLTVCPGQTERLGKKLCQEVLKRRLKERALVIALSGDLGGGKTTFLKGFARGLGIKDKILSPTFIIMRKSQIPNPEQRFRFFYHLDCYRIEKPKEILELGFREIIADPKNIVAIEWSEKIKKILPPNTFSVKFELVTGKQNQRRIIVSRPKWF